MISIISPIAHAEVTLIDVSADGEACIFKVNGKIVVVDEKDTKVVDGYRIYVQKAYPTNAQAKDSDKCETLISSISGGKMVTQSEGEKKEEGTAQTEKIKTEETPTEKTTDTDKKKQENGIGGKVKTKQNTLSRAQPAQTPWFVRIMNFLKTVWRS